MKVLEITNLSITWRDSVSLGYPLRVMAKQLSFTNCIKHFRHTAEVFFRTIIHNS